MPQPAGRGGGGVLHSLWNASNRVPATSVLIDLCTISRAGSLGAGSLDRSSGSVTGPIRDVLGTDVPCRVEVLPARSAAAHLVGEQQVTTREYIVQVPYDFTDVKVDDRLEVTDSGDPGLVGRTFRVLSVNATSLQWSRVLRCQADEG